ICSFFFQAEDGIRDFHVTGVQTCALPIWIDAGRVVALMKNIQAIGYRAVRQRVGQAVGKAILVLSGEVDASIPVLINPPLPNPRSEERRVGKACGSEWSTEQ